MRSLAIVPAVAALVATSASASAASQLVVVNRSMAGAKLGMPPTAVTKVLGKPTSRSACGATAMDRALCGGPGVVSWRYAKRRLSVTFFRDRVVRLSTTSSTLRTRDGVGVGVDMRKVVRSFSSGTVGGRPSFKWYFLGPAPTATGDVYTLVSNASGTLTGKVRDFDIGRFDTTRRCAFFSDSPQCA